MDVELLRKLGQRPLALDGGQSHLRLESRAVIPARSSRHRLSCSRAILAAVRQKLHLSTCPNLPSQLSPGQRTPPPLEAQGAVRDIAHVSVLGSNPADWYLSAHYHRGKHGHTSSAAAS